ncbi:MAG TPA: sigma-70 family RNA polymerase sigma factor [Puia sp.]|nr:sigma-70 family RNA polymerase sigma factor [Puia sp.]
MKKIPPNDEMIARFRMGDRAVYGAIYTHYYKYVVFIAYDILMDEAAANDIASDLFLKLWQQREKFEKGEEIKAWLMVACRYASLNELRHRRRLEIMKRGLLFLASRHLSSYEHQLIEVEVARDLLIQVKGLPPRCREVAELMFFQGKKTKEVAIQLGISPVTVQSHKTNALTKLRAFRQRFIR